MDAFPGYTVFNKTKKVLCVMQIVEDATAGNVTQSSVMEHTDDEVINAYDLSDQKTDSDIADKYILGYQDSNFDASKEVDAVSSKTSDTE
jgi:hypothetical protein